MEPLRAVPPMAGPTSVQERQAGGNRRQADAFRQALQQQAGGQRDADSEREAALRSRLQVAAVAGRKDEGAARHVDVIA
jgi:hypothetical protein